MVLRAIVVTAVAAVFVAGRRHEPATAYAVLDARRRPSSLRLGQDNAGALQGLVDVHIPLVHQAPSLGLEVRQGPDHRFLGRVADGLGILKREVVCFVE